MKNRFEILVARCEVGGLKCDKVVTIESVNTLQESEIIADNAKSNSKFASEFMPLTNNKVYCVDVIDKENNDDIVYQTSIDNE